MLPFYFAGELVGVEYLLAQSGGRLIMRLPEFDVEDEDADSTATEETATAVDEMEDVELDPTVDIPQLLADPTVQAPELTPDEKSAVISDIVQPTAARSATPPAVISDQPTRARSATPPAVMSDSNQPTQARSPTPPRVASPDQQSPAQTLTPPQPQQDLDTSMSPLRLSLSQCSSPDLYSSQSFTSPSSPTFSLIPPSLEPAPHAEEESEEPPLPLYAPRRKSMLRRSSATSTIPLQPSYSPPAPPPSAPAPPPSAPAPLQDNQAAAGPSASQPAPDDSTAPPDDLPASLTAQDHLSATPPSCPV